MARSIQDLDPTEFENLVYDLVRSLGMQNLVWRTPGADGGRDLEGLIDEGDFSGQSVGRRWYIECKRYASSVSWPLVWEKIAYSDAAHADYLLVVTTSKFSTRCVDEVAKWNARNRFPQVRLWPQHDVLLKLSQRLDIQAKYGLIEPVALPIGLMRTLAEQVGKMVLAAASSSPAPGQSNRYLDAAAALSRLMTVRTSDLLTHGRILVHSAALWPPGYDWLTVDPSVDLSVIDGPSLDAAVCFAGVLSRNSDLTLSRQGDVVSIESPRPWSATNRATAALWNEIANWGNAEISQRETSINITERNRHD